MATYLHCLLRPASEGPPALAGVCGAPVRALRAGRLVGWVTDLSGAAPPAPTPQAASAHDAVAQAAVLRGDDVVPARFGQWFESDDACARELARREPAILQAFDRIRGCVERRLIVPLLPVESSDVAARGAPRAPSAPGARDARGREYLERLRGEQTREWIVQQLADSARVLIDARMSSCVRESSHRVSPLPAATLTIAHLVSREDEASYASALEGLRAESRLRAAVATGPWAPYSFTGLADE